LITIIRIKRQRDDKGSETATTRHKPIADTRTLT